MAVLPSFHSDRSDTGEKRMSFLVVETRGELYAVRWSLVRETRTLSESEIDFSVVPPQACSDGLSFPLFYLWELVELSRPAEKLSEIPAVFLEEQEKRMLLVPDRILWRQEADIQQLPPWLKKAALVKGAIVASNGVAVILLEPFEFHSVSEGTR